jgi:5'-methylthioadenosine phosphorylase
MNIGIIGGTAIYESKAFNFVKSICIDTEYGKPSDNIEHFKSANHDFYFLARHGKKHSLPPHKINYRANIAAFKKLGIEKIIAFNAVGGINNLLEPGDFVISDNAIDMTSNRKSTFFNEGDIYHIDLTEPFCPILRNDLINLLTELNIRFHQRGTYICTNGPRMETAAEIKYFKQIGADIVGMTLFPEVTLARESEICYTNISIVSNFAAGISKNKLTSEEVIQTVKQSEDKINNILENLHKHISDNFDCKCNMALNKNKISK